MSFAQRAPGFLVTKESFTLKGENDFGSESENMGYKSPKSVSPRTQHRPGLDSIWLTVRG